MNVTIQDLLAELATRDIDTINRARNTLVQLGTPAVASLISLLRYGTTHQIANAIVVLGRIGDPQCIDGLLALQQHPNLIIRSNLAKSLGCFQDKQVVQTLIDMLTGDHEIVQQWTIISLGRLGGFDLDLLIQFMQTTESTSLCHITITALGELGDPQVISSIEPFLDSSNHHVRKAAQLALSKLNAQKT